MISDADLFERVRLLRDIHDHRRGEEGTLTDIFGDWVLVEFADAWGVAVAPGDLERVRGASAAA